MASRNPLDGTAFAGMEHMFATIIRQDEEDGPITITSIRNGMPSTPSTTDSIATIPTRVSCGVPTEARRTDDRTTLHVLQEVQEGDLVFAIQDPLIYIVDNGLNALKSTCDYCLAKVERHPDGKLNTSTVPDFDLTFMACGGCTTMYYCNKICQKAAWSHHHKAECKLLTTAKERNFHMEDGSSLVFSRTFRFMLRLLTRHKTGKITEEQLAEISMLPKREYITATELSVKAGMQEYAAMLQELTRTSLSKDEVFSLHNIMYRNEGDIFLPLMEGGSKNYQTEISSTIKPAGVYLDPFVSSIGHSCDPNSWVVFESNHFRVRALKSIPAGTEISISLLDMLSILKVDVGDYASRKLHLSHIKFDCDCALCQRGPLDLPCGPVYARLKKYEDMQPGTLQLNHVSDRLTDIERAIADINSAGHGFQSVHMPFLVKQAITSYTLQFKTAKALKSCLALYYHIEPAQMRPTPRSERIDTLFILMSLLNNKLHNCHPRVQALEPLPAWIDDLRIHVIFHLEGKVVSETARCFGHDSMAAKCGKHIFDDFFEKLESMKLAAGVVYPKFVPLTEDPEIAAEFVRVMNALMEWAELPTLTLDQYLR